jgi:hypothetical protein
MSTGSRPYWLFEPGAPKKDLAGYNQAKKSTDAQEAIFIVLKVSDILVELAPG